jgi:hypothetical protein
VQERDAERILGRSDVDETRQLSRRYRAGATTPESYLASRTGPLAYMVRLRRIEDLTAAHEEALAEAWRGLAAEHASDPATFAERWQETANRWGFHVVNRLIENHNRWYPAESRLPMNPRTGDFVPVAGRTYRREPLDAAWALRCFPPDLKLALEP